MNLKNLAIIFVALLAVVVIIRLYESKKGERSFRKDIVNFDVANVSDISIIPKSGAEQVNLSKKSAGWIVKNGETSYNADETMVENMMNDLLKLIPKRVAATTKEKWSDFEVTDSLATRVIFKDGNKTLADIFIGKFSYQQPKNQYQQQGTMTSYVRLADEKIVYAVDGFLSMTYNRDINSFRNKYIIKAKKTDLNKITFNYPDSSYTMLKENNKWMINGLLADSTSVDKYLSSIATTSNQDFVDNVEIGTLGPAQYSVLIEGDNFNPIDVKSYNNLLDTANNVLITSTYNRGTVFSGTKSDLMEKIFVGKSKFLK
ncbi:DUF4340 domain-containing protein [Bacteroidota bacterium]